MEIYDWFVFISLSFWFILTVRFHIPLKGNYLLRIKDLFGIIPDWRFFCPTPVKDNYFILYRDFANGVDITSWKELDLMPARELYQILWNPSRKYRKAFLDICIEIITISSTNKNDTNVIIGSISYLAILNHVSKIPKDSAANFTQFAVMTRSSIDKTSDTELALLSGIHLLS